VSNAMNLDGLTRWGGLPEVSLAEAGAVVAGIAYDGSAVYRRGAALAPDAVRTLSACLPPLDERGRSLEGLRLHDLGDMTMPDGVERGWEAVASRLSAVPPGVLLNVIGGDHCAAIPVVAAQARRHPDLAVLWVDAHPDLCDWSRGGRWTCGCALRRAIEVAELPPERVALVGCRDFDADEVAFVERHGMTLVPAAELADDPAGARSRLDAALGGRPLLVSFDIDALDPAFAPGTEIASAGGLSTREALRLLAWVAAGRTLVGFDVYEVAPPLDHAEVTVLAALKLLFEVWSLRGR
jgi:agmatinase